MPAKLYLNDIPAALEDVIQKIREGLRNTRNDNVAIVLPPDKIRFRFETILHLNSLTRPETSTKDATVTTVAENAATDTETRVTAAQRIMDETESMTWTRSGNENTTESGNESGTSSGGQNASHADSGGEIETYNYINA